MAQDDRRGERFDEAQGGGGADPVSRDDEEIARDQAAHQDRGQGAAEAETGGR